MYDEVMKVWKVYHFKRKIFYRAFILGDHQITVDPITLLVVHQA